MINRIVLFHINYLKHVSLHLWNINMALISNVYYSVLGNPIISNISTKRHKKLFDINSVFRYLNLFRQEIPKVFDISNQVQFCLFVDLNLNVSTSRAFLTNIYYCFHKSLYLYLCNGILYRSTNIFSLKYTCFNESGHIYIIEKNIWIWSIWINFKKILYGE